MTVAPDTVNALAGVDELVSRPTASVNVRSTCVPAASSAEEAYAGAVVSTSTGEEETVAVLPTLSVPVSV